MSNTAADLAAVISKLFYSGNFQDNCRDYAEAAHITIEEARKDLLQAIIEKHLREAGKTREAKSASSRL